MPLSVATTPSATWRHGAAQSTLHETSRAALPACFYMKGLIILFVLASAGPRSPETSQCRKLFSGMCAFDESCRYFPGYPACWYGFAMYLIMVHVAGFGLRDVVSRLRSCN
jgi:hypothetical protein